MNSERTPPPVRGPSEGEGGPPEDEETRLMFERAESAWRRQVAHEEADTPPPVGPGTLFRWFVIGIIGAGLLFLFLTRLG